MRISIRLGGALVVLALALVLWGPRNGDAVAAGAAEVTIASPWARATPGALKIGAAYLEMTNRGAVADRLLGARTAAAERVEMHATTQDDGVMRMRPVESVALPPGQTVRFEPGGRHLMLVNLAAPLQAGGEIAMTLTFERAGALEVRVAIAPAGAAAKPDNDHADHHK